MSAITRKSEDFAAIAACFEGLPPYLSSKLESVANNENARLDFLHPESIIYKDAWRVALACNHLVSEVLRFGQMEGEAQERIVPGLERNGHTGRFPSTVLMVTLPYVCNEEDKKLPSLDINELRQKNDIPLPIYFKKHLKSTNEKVANISIFIKSIKISEYFNYNLAEILKFASFNASHQNALISDINENDTPKGLNSDAIYYSVRYSCYVNEAPGLRAKKTGI